MSKYFNKIDQTLSTENRNLIGIEQKNNLKFGKQI